MSLYCISLIPSLVVNNKDQLAVSSLINCVPQEGCVPFVFATAGPSLPHLNTHSLTEKCARDRKKEDKNKMWKELGHIFFIMQTNQKHHILQSDTMKQFVVEGEAHECKRCRADKESHRLPPMGNLELPITLGIEP